jgi:SAM-dependent methyltransferase
VTAQNKVAEIGFFDRHAAGQSYDAFTPPSSEKLMQRCMELSAVRPPARVADLGCASGTFTTILTREGFHCAGIDISHAMTALGRRQHPTVPFVTGDIEALPFRSDSLDAVFLTGVLHHLPNPSPCAREVFRVLRPGGAFVAFDPNGANPFFYLYRDPDSPLYSSKGVSPNERPALAANLKRVFSNAGFDVDCDYLSGLRYQYIASPLARVVLPIYHALDSLLFWPHLLRHRRAFILTHGTKPAPAAAR